MNVLQQQKILRYAELVYREGHRELTDAEKEEKQCLLGELVMSHEQILQLAAQNTIPEGPCG